MERDKRLKKLGKVGDAEAGRVVTAFQAVQRAVGTIGKENGDHSDVFSLAVIGQIREEKL